MTIIAPSSAPLQLKSHVIDSRTLRLSWSVPEPSDHNGVIRGYHIELYETETDTTQQYETTTTHVVISSLHPDYTYEWSVAAVTVAEGPYSNTVNVTTPEDGENITLFMCIVFHIVTIGTMYIQY